MEDKIICPTCGLENDKTAIKCVRCSGLLKKIKVGCENCMGCGFHFGKKPCKGK